MSFSCMVTTSAEMDPAMGDNINVRNGVCLLVTTHGDETPLYPSSFREEDVVALCIKIGKEHPEGVLKLLDTEANWGLGAS